MARAGAIVTGIDVTQRSIEIAKIHAQRSDLDIDYRCETVEQHLAEGNQPMTWC